MANQNSRVFEVIYRVVKIIPAGKVSTYKAVAKKARTTPRVVGFALHRNPDPKNIPCHRIVKKDGGLAEGYAFGGKKVQKEKLLKEGVGFKDETQVDLEKYLWKEEKML